MGKSKLSICLTAIVLFSGLAYAEPPQEALSLQKAFVEVSKKVGPSVVSISIEQIEHYQTRYYPFKQFEDDFFDNFFNDFFVAGPEREFRRMGLGSGVIIDKEGYILTNEHVIHSADKIKVTLPDGREFEGKVTGADIYSDLAIVKIDSKEDLPFAVLGNSDDVQIGIWAIAIGNPFAFAVKSPEPTVTVGVISALHRSLPRTDKRTREYSDLIQTDAAINPGNSGGPLVNIYGEVIGINVAIFTLSGGSEGIGFAVPINTAKRVMGDLMQGREVLYGWLGIVIQDIDENLAEYFSMGEKSGVLVSRIVDLSPADKAGLLPGDIVLSIGDEKVKDSQDLIRKIMKKNIGDKVNLGIMRNNKLNKIGVVIAARPGDKAIETQQKKAQGEPIPQQKAMEIKIWRGLEVSDITADIAKRYKLDRDTGVIVLGIQQSSPAEASGIRIGDIIYEINRIPVKNMVDYKNAVTRVSGDVLVGTYRGYVVLKEK